MSSGGYPGDYDKGLEVHGLDSVSPDDTDCIVFHAGTKKDGKKYVTNGGRVLGITGLGLGLDKAIARAYAATEKIAFERCFFRRDIGAKAFTQNSNSRASTHR